MSESAVEAQIRQALQGGLDVVELSVQLPLGSGSGREDPAIVESIDTYLHRTLQRSAAKMDKTIIAVTSPVSRNDYRCLVGYAIGMIHLERIQDPRGQTPAKYRRSIERLQ